MNYTKVSARLNNRKIKINKKTKNKLTMVVIRYIMKYVSTEK